ncbi:MAG: nicotinamide riboside transporter PnuC [Pseudomonadota bacterium]
MTWVDPWLMPVFSAWGVPVSGLEVWAFVLSLGMVWLNMRVNPWGWPLAIISSLMYGLLFARSQLYGEASLQLVFVVLSVWGWWQWLYGRNPLNQALRVQVLGRQGRLIGMLVVLLSWPALGLLLDHATDSDVPYMDAFPSAASLLGQWLLGRKYLENWPTWLVVNVFSVVLFAYKGLWLTFILYGLFAVLSWVGWRQWRVVMSRQ